SCIYGMGNPTEYEKGIVRVYVKQTLSRQRFLHLLLDALYHRNDETFDRGSFRVKGDTVDVHLPYLDFGYRIIFFGDEIESIESIIISSGKKLEDLDIVAIFPANLYVAPKEILPLVINEIQDEMNAQITYFKKNQKVEEADRIKERVEHDIEMIRELGYCSGIENYSRFFDRRKPNTRPFCLIDYFPQDFLCIIDESHQTIPQLNGMYGGDRSRKMNLVEYGFRLPSALDNRPLKFDEFENVTNQTIYVSATPNDYELNKTGGEIIEQVVRPTGLLDPIIEVRPSLNQIDNLIEEIKKRIEANERVLVTTLTKKMAEELDKYLQKMDILSQYIHSDVDTLDRVEILRNLRLGNINVLVGVNLLREGLDLPEVSLVAILDADKEGFLRNQKSLTQTAGRAARNVHGFVIFYADKITKSMKETINETQRRREKQIKYNIKNNITPKTIIKSVEQVMAQTSVLEFKELTHVQERVNAAAETNSPFDKNVKLNAAEVTKKIKEINKQIKTAIKATDFLEAARLRDELMKLK
ncbi:MAG: helicase-related protein, partial [Sediminibacterium sp.]|nr:helicase-related protein [Sediminibacterium sp.]